MMIHLLDHQVQSLDVIAVDGQLKWIHLRNRICFSAQQLKCLLLLDIAFVAFFVILVWNDESVVHHSIEVEFDYIFDFIFGAQLLKLFEFTWILY